ncbi:membrane protease YdiL (CAAX protease family) [Bradyrhizobium sp. F1.13.1]
MTDLLKSGRDKGAAVMLLFAFSVAAPMSEEVLARGFLYRGWSASFLRVPGAIILSSLLWTVVHLQYDLYFLAEVFSIGLWFGYMRYRSNSLWLTIVLHALNNLTAVVLTMWLGG